MMCVIVLPLVGLSALLFAASENTVRLPDWALDRLEAEANAGLKGRGEIELQAAGIGIDLETNSMVLHVIEGRVLSKTGRPALRLEEAVLTLAGPALLRGEIVPRSLALSGVRLRIQRLLDGTLDVAFAGDGTGFNALPSTLGEALDALDVIAVEPAVAELSTIAVEGVEVIYSDLQTGRRLALRDGRLSLFRRADQVSVVLGVDMPGYGLTEDQATARLSLTHGIGAGAALQAQVVDLPIADLATTFGPTEKAGLLDARLTGAVNATATQGGQIEGVEANLSFGPGRIIGVDALRFDSLQAEVRFDPAARRIDVVSSVLNSDQLRMAMTGQALLGARLSDPIIAQLRTTDLWLDPDGIFAKPVDFDTGVFEGRVTLAPFRIEIGQAHIGNEGQGVTARGDIAFEDTGIAGHLNLSSPGIDVARIKTLWPPTLVPKTRAWVMRSVYNGQITAMAASLRVAPGDGPKASAHFEFEEAELRFLRHLPPARQAHGVAQLEGQRLTFRVDGGHVPHETYGDVTMAGTVFTIADVTKRPAVGEVGLRVEGRIPAVLTLLDNKPFDVLSRANRPATLAEGRAVVEGTVRVPLIKKPPPDQIEFDVSGRLTNLRSETLVEGRNLLAQSLDLRVRPEGIEISGPVRLDGVPARVNWRQPIVPKGAPPQPARLTGVAQVDAEALRVFGVNLGQIAVGGTTRAAFEMDLIKDTPGALKVTSDLGGLSLSAPGLGWRKTASQTGTLTVDTILGKPARIPNLSLSLPGLSLAGDITLEPGGGMKVASFDRVQLGGWLDAPLRLVGRGAGRAAAIEVGGGSVDLRRADFGSGGGGGSGTGPLKLELDRLVISDGIVLDQFAGELSDAGGLGGTFTARVNGNAAIRGTLAPTDQGTAIRILSTDAGGVLSSVKAFKDAVGGNLDLTLLPRAGEGRYNGTVQIDNLRVRNAPALAQLLSAASIVGLLEQLDGEGLVFSDVSGTFEVRPGDIRILRAAALGPSMGISADGVVDLSGGRVDLQGTVSPFYAVNGLLGGLFARRKEGLIGINYTLTGPTTAPRVFVNPLSVLTPGVFRDIFRRPPPQPSQ